MTQNSLLVQKKSLSWRIITLNHVDFKTVPDLDIKNKVIVSIIQSTKAPSQKTLTSVLNCFNII